MIYLDTSALIKLYILEKGSEKVQSRIAAQDYPLPVWEFQEAELTNALHLKVFWKEITLDQAQQQISLFQKRKKNGFYFYPEMDRYLLMEKFHELSQRSAHNGCRTMDIFHIACALQISCQQFMTFDQRQRSLALEVGLHAPDYR